MLTYPTLQSGAIAQYPLQLQWNARLIANEYADGSAQWQLDPRSRRRRWTIDYQALGEAEKNQLVSFFESCAGRLNEFAFCDPLDNLLGDSANLTSTRWRRSTSVDAQAGLDDPNGTTTAFRVINGSQAEGSLAQDLAEAGGGEYCLSAWLRGNSTPARLQIQSGPVQKEMLVPLGTAWQRVWVSAATSGGVSASLVLPSGGTVDVFGLQLESQAAPSAYKATTGAGGFYTNARFDQDELICVETEMGRFQSRVVVVARIAE